MKKVLWSLTIIAQRRGFRAFGKEGPTRATLQPELAVVNWVQLFNQEGKQGHRQYETRNHNTVSDCSSSYRQESRLKFCFFHELSLFTTSKFSRSVARRWIVTLNSGARRRIKHLDALIAFRGTCSGFDCKLESDFQHQPKMKHSLLVTQEAIAKLAEAWLVEDILQMHSEVACRWRMSGWLRSVLEIDKIQSQIKELD